MTIRDFLDTATAEFTKAGIATARLDALVMLANATGHDKSWVLAHGDERLQSSKELLLADWLRRRRAREPLAYISTRQAFYGRDFLVTPQVLIPRPETEALITQLKNLQPKSLLDVGTGSGAIAITTALELPKTSVAACDISPDALFIARQNATALGAKITLFASDLLQHAGTYHAIVANLPYVDPTWQRSLETNYEPHLALFANDHGLALIKKLIDDAPAHLGPKGFLLLEADPRQFAAIKTYAAQHFAVAAQDGFTLTLQRCN